MGMEMEMERNYLLGFALCDKVAPATLRKLVRSFQSAKSVWEAASADWTTRVRMNQQTVWALDSWRRRVQPGEHLEAHLQRQGIRVVVQGDTIYPERLFDLADPPLVLFIRGGLPIHIMSGNSFAIIGTRRASGYGLEATRWIADTLSRNEVSVLSGMALGIDGAAHQAALNADGKTIAILGCGVNVCYPQSNYRIYSQIIDNGLIVSEYAPDAKVAKYHFPERNRIIAALAKVVIVVQAGEKSGALLTVDHALELGRDVHVVPGPITSAHFRGSHKLLSQGAQVLLDPADMLRAYGIEIQVSKSLIIPERWRALYEAIDGTSHPTHLASQLQVSPSHVYAGLLELELSGVLERGGDGMYRRKFI